MAQRIITPEGGYRALDAWLAEAGCRRLLLVAGGSTLFYYFYRKRHGDEDAPEAEQSEE